MQFLRELSANHVLIATAISWAVAQGTKVIINLFKVKKLDLKVIFANGGMPSGHTATVIALTVMSAYVDGFSSASFAIALILSMVVIRDATGVRLEVSKHAKTIKQLCETVKSQCPEEKISTDDYKMRVGHTSSEVAMGALAGAVVSVLYILLILN